MHRKTKILKKIRFPYLAILLIILFNSCESDNDADTNESEFISPDQFNSEVVVRWFNLIKVLTTETVGYTPPVAARAFGYTGVALYESTQVE